MANSIKKEAVNHPDHYGGKDNPYEAIKVIEAWDLNFNDGNAVKYVSRAGKKDPNKAIEDREKAIWYLQREVNKLKAKRDGITKKRKPYRRRRKKRTTRVKK